MGVIYKITSPKNRIYIGQTIDFKIRIKKYKRLDCCNQKKLFNSFNKYGFDNHKIEILEHCKNSELNDKERYYQDLFTSTNRYGLNIRLTKTSDRSGTFSDESKRKMSLAKIGKKRSPEVRKAISEKMKIIASQRGSDFYEIFKACNKGRKHTQEHKEKNSSAKKGNKFRSAHCKNKKND